MAPVIPILPDDYKARRDAGKAVAKRNFDKLVADHPWLPDLSSEIGKILNANAGVRSKFAQLNKLADRIAEAVSTVAACRRGCSYCCNISVAISSFEAEKIAEITGRAISPLKASINLDSIANDNYNKPCPFSVENECSIYEHRPLACRLHFNIDDTPFFCDTKILPEDSAVPNVDLGMFWMAYAGLFLKLPLGDIRDFFPPESEKTA